MVRAKSVCERERETEGERKPAGERRITRVREGEQESVRGAE